MLIISLRFIEYGFSAAIMLISIALINGKDIFGFEGKGRKLSGAFGDEFIAGGFIQRFFVYDFFLLCMDRPDGLFVSGTLKMFCYVFQPCV